MSNPFVQHGAASWIELTTTDVDAAKTFYSTLLGWTLRDESMGESGQTYTVVKAGDTEIGGMMHQPPGMEAMRPAWSNYITVDNVDATAQKAQELGATTIVPPTDIPGVGRFYVFQDPQGAVISVITYTEEVQASRAS
ncbi:VOC family protein [Candidatus Entotheonella palauensis]|uniref:VOC family protein n=1 Tax=Candidatus Entotheonella palauensis TaxID=93172 RepID=UPI000B7F0DD1|nr:VOC family protein [Candidatus Entotheonella palauensis]